MPVTAEGAVPPAEAESEEAAGARLMVWMTPAPGFHAEEDAVAASRSIAESAYPRWNLSVMNGISAGTLPDAKSTARCPPESAPIARLSIPGLMHPMLAGRGSQAAVL